MTLSLGEILTGIGTIISAIIVYIFKRKADKKKQEEAKKQMIKEIITEAQLDITQKAELENKIKAVDDKLSKCQSARDLIAEKRFGLIHEEILKLELGFKNYNGTISQAINGMKEVFEVKFENLENIIIKHIEGK